MVRLGLAGTLIVGMGGMAWADSALVIGPPEGQGRGFLGASGMPDVPAALAEAGLDVVAPSLGSLPEMRAGLAAVYESLPNDQRLAVFLAGAFVTDGARTWLLPQGGQGPVTLATVDAEALSVDTVLQIAGGLPGRAVVALGEVVTDREIGAGLTAGIALARLPQGVTLLQGTSQAVARAVARELTEPGRPLTLLGEDRRAVAVSGFVAPHLSFLPPRDPAEQAAAEMQRAIWEAARQQDTIAGYRGYLSRFPEGEFAEEARAAIRIIEEEPERAARLEEEGLNLTRDARREIQRALTLLGYEPRGIDGLFGPGTRGAIQRFQTELGFPVTGYLTRIQIDRLALRAERRQAELEAEAERRRLEEERRDRATWQSTGAVGDEAGLRTYLKRYPDGLFSEIAQTRLDEIVEARRREAEAADRAAFETAEAEGTAEAYRRYLQANPDGAFVDEAQARIDGLRAEQQAQSNDREAQERALGLNQVTMTLVEQRLAQLDLETGPVDGVFDDQTRRAIRRFQRGRDLEPTGYLDELTVTRMLADLGGLILGGGDN